MKRTTYICIAMLLAGLFSLCGLVVCHNRCGTPIDESLQTLTLKGGEQTLSLPATCRKVEVRCHSSNDTTYTNPDLPLRICSTDAAESTLSFPAELESYLRLEEDGDKLTIHFDLFADRLPQPFKGRIGVGIEIDSALCLAVNQQVADVATHLEYAYIYLNGMKRDTFALNVEGRLFVNDCKLDALTVNATDELHLTNVQADRLHIDLDTTDEFYPDSSTINTMYVSGSYRRDFSWNTNYSRRLRWLPKNEESELQLTLGEAAEVRRLD